MNYKHHNVDLIPFDEKQRFDQIKRNIPEIKSFKTLLYIGARKKGFQFHDILTGLGYNITVLEAYLPNVMTLEKETVNVITGDIREFETDRIWDVIMWWHGPEHISKKELPGILRKIEQSAKHLVIFGCPWGVYEQGESYGNPFEVHQSYLYPNDFTKLRYNVESLGERDRPGSNLLAWKWSG